MAYREGGTNHNGLLMTGARQQIWREIEAMQNSCRARMVLFTGSGEFMSGGGRADGCFRTSHWPGVTLYISAGILSPYLLAHELYQNRARTREAARHWQMHFRCTSDALQMHFWLAQACCSGPALVGVTTWARITILAALTMPISTSRVGTHPMDSFNT